MTLAPEAPTFATTPGRLYIDGAWTEAAGADRRDVINPATGEVLTTVPEGGAADIDRAVASARKAFDEGPWPRMTPRDRSRVLNRVAQLMRERFEELALLESIDVGKPIALCRMVDIETSIQHFEYYAALAQAEQGATRSIAIPSHAYTLVEPIGVIGAITPFNFPLILSTSKIAPALAAGNTVVHKPAEDTPLTALWLAELMTEAGVPEGVLNVVTGGIEAGDALLRHKAVDKIAFTGSTAVGRHIAKVAGEQLKPVTVELGGKSANIVFDDADVETAVGAAIKAFVFNTGQFCMAGSRLLVQRGLYDTITGILAEAVGTVPVGDPFDEATVVGPMTGARHLQKVVEFVDAAKAEGARVVAGGSTLDGLYYAPTVLADLDLDARAVREEIFGPVTVVIPFETEAEAIAIANDSEYGLAAGIQTSDVARAHRVAAQLKAGIVWVNDWGMMDASMPFGGYKASGFGREYGPEGLAEYTQVKSVIISVPPQG